MPLLDQAVIMSAQSGIGMRESWSTFWRDGSELANLFDTLAPSDLQRSFLGGLSPVEAPAIGLEVSRRGIRRKPQMAFLLLSRRLLRWRTLLAPLLQADGCFAGGLQLTDLSPFFQSLQGEDVWFDQATWVEYTQPPRGGAGQPFLLFRRTTQPWSVAQMKLRLERIHDALPETLRQRLTLPSVDWWDAVDALPIEGLDQLGVDFSAESGCWRFLFGVSQPESLCSALRFPEDVTRAFQGCPIALALDSRHRPVDRYAIEVFPRYRQEHTVTAYPGEVPADPGQWPTWPTHPAFLPPKRLAALMRKSVHAPAVEFGKQALSLRGGLSHQKLVVEAGELIDHKAYLGVMVAASRAKSHASHAGSSSSKDSPALNHALDLLVEADRWTGFALNPGSSDLWVPLACLTLLAPWRQHPRLRDAYARQCKSMRAILEAPAPVGYSQATPADSDSSLWLKRCLVALGLPSSSSLDAYLEEAWRPQVGIRTYATPLAVAAFIQRPASALNGWCSPHDCVLANLAASHELPDATQALALLRGRLELNQFRSYWWPLDGLMLSLLPRGALPRFAVERVIAQQLSPAVRAQMPPDRAEGLLIFSRSLMQLVHGTSEEQQTALAKMDHLLISPKSFSQLLVMQLPDPDCRDPKSQERWIWSGGMEGALAPDDQGCLAAALLLAAQVRSR